VHKHKYILESITSTHCFDGVRSFAEIREWDTKCLHRRNERHAGKGFDHIFELRPAAEVNPEEVVPKTKYHIQYDQRFRRISKRLPNGKFRVILEQHTVKTLKSLQSRWLPYVR
jgi:hypothetical protein